ncbi:MAG: hypothetical protein WC209_07945 [Ignavibacteriaceae bacterium]|jgi:hypothetical protein
MFSSFSKFVVNILFIIPLLFFGCKKESNQVQINKPELKSVEQIPEISGLYFGYLKNVSFEDGSYFASIVFVEHQVKNNEHQQKSVVKFADSLEILELPDEYFVAVKGNSPEQFLIDSTAKIVMQTFSRDVSGGYKFNENIDRIKLNKLFASKESRRFSQIPFRFSLMHNTILSIEEKYIP